MTLDTVVNHPLSALADSFVQKIRQGERLSVSEYMERYPEHAGEIEDLLTTLVMLEEAKANSLGSLVNSSAIHEHMPTQLGDFRIIRVIGRGGMGVVYEAEQQSLGRRVALKVLPTSAHANPSELARFHREAKAAARLHHTNIVPVYGVGEDQGVHYFVMQCVQGESLDCLIDELHGLVTVCNGHASANNEIAPAPTASSILASSLLSETFPPSATRPKGVAGDGDNSSREERRPVPQKAMPGNRPHRAKSKRIHGFRFPKSYWRRVTQIGMQAAEALQYAHGRDTVHRDIKPSNLILDEDEKVWITDFGLAKAGDEHGLTSTGDVLGTLQYMAPESFEGRLDARSDIYSLGLTLYELAALVPARSGVTRNELIQRVREGSVPRLSKVNAQVPRDLETIIHKAVNPDPRKRYQTGGEMADDLKRFDNDLPIRARRTGLAERIGRWCRRNPRVSLISGSAAFTVLVTICIAFAMITTSRNRAVHLAFKEGLARRETESAFKQAELQRQVADVQRQEAERSANRARAVTEFLIDMIDTARPEKSRGRAMTVREVLDRASAMVGDGFADDPEKEATVRWTIARAYYSLGRYEEAEHHWTRALKIRQRVLGPEHLETLGTMNDLASNYYGRGQPAAGLRLEEKALKILLRVHGPEHPMTLTTMGNMASNLHAQGKYSQAQQLFERALGLQRRVLGLENASTMATMSNLALNLHVQGKFVASSKLNRKTLEMRQRLLGKDHPSTLVSMGNLAHDLNAMRKFDEAQTLAEQVFRARCRILGPEHPHTLAAINNLAAILDEQEDATDTRNLYQKIIDISSRVLGSDHPNTFVVVSNYAFELQQQGNIAEAQEAYRRALESAQKTLGANHPISIKILANLADSYFSEGRHADAQQLYETVFDVESVSDEGQDPWPLGITLAMARVLIAQDKHAQAAGLIQAQLDTHVDTDRRWDWRVGFLKCLAGRSWDTAGQSAKAEPMLLTGYQVMELDPHASSNRLADALAWIIEYYDTQGKTEEAARWREKQLAPTASGPSISEAKP